MIIEPFLSLQSGKFTTLEAMLEEGSCKDIHILKDCVQSSQWKHVCDVKRMQETRISCNESSLSLSLSLFFLPLSLSTGISDEVTVYKFSKEKATSWLRAKVEAQATSLEEKKVYVGVGSQSSMLVKSNKRSDLTRSLSPVWR